MSTTPAPKRDFPNTAEWLKARGIEGVTHLRLDFAPNEPSVLTIELTRFLEGDELLSFLEAAHADGVVTS